MSTWITTKDAVIKQIPNSNQLLYCTVLYYITSSLKDADITRQIVAIYRQWCVNLNQQSTLRTVCMCVSVSLCTTVVHNTAQNSSNNLLSYPPDSHHYSDVVYQRTTTTSTIANTLHPFNGFFPGQPS